MALLSDAAYFYLRVFTTWMVSATVAAAIVRGWIRGPGFHPKKSHLVVLVYSFILARQGLRLHKVHGNISEYYYCRCKRPGAAGVPAAGECVPVDGAYIRDLVELTDHCYLLMMLLGVTLGDAIWRKRAPSRPRVPEGRSLRAVGGIVFEILVFISCALSCSVDRKLHRMAGMLVRHSV